MQTSFELVTGVSYAYELPDSYAYADEGIKVEFYRGKANFVFYDDY